MVVVVFVGSGCRLFLRMAVIGVYSTLTTILELVRSEHGRDELLSELEQPLGPLSNLRGVSFLQGPNRWM